MPVYPNRDRALRHIKRTRAAYLYGRFPQRHILGMPCCDPGLLTMGRDHSSKCLANVARLQGTLVQVNGKMRLAAYYQGDQSVPSLPGASTFQHTR